MYKKIFILLSALCVGVAEADLSTGRFDGFNLNYGRTTSSDVNVFGHDWCWDLPLYPTQNSAAHLLFGITRWQDNSVADNSFVGLHLTPSLRFVLPSNNELFSPYFDFGVGVAYFGRKDFGDHYSLGSDIKMETDITIGANFGAQSEYELGIAYTHYGLGGGDDVDLLPRVYFGYHF